MQHILLVQIVDGIADFVEFAGCVFFFEFFVDLDVLVERAVLHVLHQDVEVGLVAEEPVHLDHVGVVGVHVYLQLLHELVQHQPKVLFLDLLDGNQTPSFLVDGWKNLTETALPLAAAQLEVLNLQTSTFPSGG